MNEKSGAQSSKYWHMYEKHGDKSGRVGNISKKKLETQIG